MVKGCCFCRTRHSPDRVRRDSNSSRQNNGGISSLSSDRYLSPLPLARNKYNEDHYGNHLNGDDRRVSDYRKSNGEFRNGRLNGSDYEDRYEGKTDTRRRSYADGSRYHQILRTRIPRISVHQFRFTSHSRPAFYLYL